MGVRNWFVGLLVVCAQTVCMATERFSCAIDLSSYAGLIKIAYQRRWIDTREIRRLGSLDAAADPLAEQTLNAAGSALSKGIASAAARIPLEQWPLVQRQLLEFAPEQEGGETECDNATRETQPFFEARPLAFFPFKGQQARNGWLYEDQKGKIHIVYSQHFTPRKNLCVRDGIDDHGIQAHLPCGGADRPDSGMQTQDRNIFFAGVDRVFDKDRVAILRSDRFGRRGTGAKSGFSGTRSRRTGFSFRLESAADGRSLQGT